LDNYGPRHTIERAKNHRTDQPFPAASADAEALRYVILRTPEVIAFMKAHNIEWPRSGGVRGNLLGQWTPDKPHISGSMDNVTVSEVLDRVLKTFPGIWIYGSKLYLRVNAVYLKRARDMTLDTDTTKNKNVNLMERSCCFVMPYSVA
jgi:hypothetical protein